MRVSDVFDAELGPSTERYFGQGYRATSYDITDINLLLSSESRVRLAAVVHLHAWERSGAPRVAHAGTIDAISVAVTLGSAALVCAGLASPGVELALAWVEVRAGAGAQQVVSGIEATIDWSVNDPENGEEIILCRFGALVVQLALICPSVDRSRLATGPKAVESLLGIPWRTRYFGGGFRQTEVVASSLAVGAESASCNYTIAGLTVGVVECLVLTSQLAQVMLYRRAGVDRAETGNLWMRRCTFRATTATEPRGTAAIRLAKYAEIARPSRHFVSAEVEILEFPGIRGSAALAFNLR
jgi:hypothetical protein